MKLKHLAVVTALAFGLSQTGSAQMMTLGSGSGSSPTPQEDLVKKELGLDCDPVFLAKWDFKGFDNGAVNWEKEGQFYDQFIVTLSSDDPESGLLSGNWSLKTGFDLGDYDLVALLVKSGQANIIENIQGQTGGEWNTDGQDISHISFFGCPKSVPEPASLLAGLSALLLGFAARKRLS